MALRPTSHAPQVTSITDKSLAALPPLPRLRRLRLTRCTSITDAGLAAAAASLPALQHLDLASTRITGSDANTQQAAAAAAAAAADPSQQVPLLPASDQEAACLTGLAALYGRLRSLSVQGCRTYGAAGLADTCLLAPRLACLRLCGTGLQPRGGSLAPLQLLGGSLLRLDLGPQWEVDDEGLEHLARWGQQLAVRSPYGGCTPVSRARTAATGAGSHGCMR